MNLAASASLASAAVAFCVGIWSLRISGAPGARGQARFSVIAFSSAAHSLGNLVTTVLSTRELVVAASSVQIASALVHAWGWLWYSRALVEGRPGRAERLAGLSLLAAAATAFVPGVVLDGQVIARPFPALGTIYHEASTTPFGTLVVGAGLAGMLPVLARLVRAWRAGASHARTLALAFAVLVAVGANDVLAFLHVLDTPNLLDLGFAAPVLAFAWAITDRLVESSRALERLQDRLTAEVAARTNDLVGALGALRVSEKLAGLGQFASGVAHEVNSPAAVVTANLRYLQEACRAGAPAPPDADEVIGDALASMKRINDLVRRLVDAGRVAATPPASAVIRVADVASSAAEQARARMPGTVSLLVDVPADLFVRARRESLAQVLDHLLANAREAIPAGRRGLVELRAERRHGAVHITVVDDGVGMPPDVLRRALEPFFTTQAGGRGAGLGLALARGLVEAHGGTLTLESTPGRGTRAVVELPAAEPAREPTPPPGR
jgi:signal transduction histidine kinase